MVYAYVSVCVLSSPSRRERASAPRPALSLPTHRLSISNSFCTLPPPNTYARTQATTMGGGATASQPHAPSSGVLHSSAVATGRPNSWAHAGTSQIGNPKLQQALIDTAAEL
jgi:hypothetical protein